MNLYQGVCQDGPLDGQALEHTSSRKELLEYKEDTGPQSLGEYRYSSAGGGCWIWEPCS